jgi:uncharacterized integral membrane protein (TIGR00698 family)
LKRGSRNCGRKRSNTHERSVSWLRERLPGVGLCIVIAIAGWLLQTAEVRLAGRPYVEALVLALLLGVAIAGLVRLPARFEAGIQFSSRELLEVAVCLIGVAIDAALLKTVGPRLFAGVIVIVVLSLAITFAIGRAAGLRPRLAVLIAAGNSICGNSAIAAVAPVIGAEPEDVAAAISFTAVLGVVVVLLLPLLVPLLHLSDARYGVVAGLTVYAVPQVLAATLPVSAAAGAIATLVKLMRVILLGPLVVAMGFVTHRPAGAKRGAMIPWFIIGFLIFATARSLGVLSAEVVGSIRVLATALTVIAMAGLGLGVDLRALRESSGRVIGVVFVSLAVLCGLAVVLARMTTA